MYTPRHLRRGAVNRSGPGKAEKSKAFRGAAMHSKRFIGQSASQLSKPSIQPGYAEWCRQADSGMLRKMKG